MRELPVNYFCLYPQADAIRVTTPFSEHCLRPACRVAEPKPSAGRGLGLQPLPTALRAESGWLMLGRRWCYAREGAFAGYMRARSHTAGVHTKALACTHAGAGGPGSCCAPERRPPAVPPACAAATVPGFASAANRAAIVRVNTWT
jgi:hypothetical protein